VPLSSTLFPKLRLACSPLANLAGALHSFPFPCKELDLPQSPRHFPPSLSRRPVPSERYSLLSVPPSTFVRRTTVSSYFSHHHRVFAYLPFGMSFTIYFPPRSPFPESRSPLRVHFFPECLFLKPHFQMMCRNLVPSLFFLSLGMAGAEFPGPNVFSCRPRLCVVQKAPSSPPPKRRSRASAAPKDLNDFANFG